MTSGDIKLNRSTVEGDVAGRDIDKSTIYINYPNNANVESYMKKLLEKFAEEQKNDSQFSGFIEDLDYYNSKKEGDVIGLEQKLIDAQKQELLEYAKDTKDRFHRKLMSYQFSEAAQKILCYLLAEIQSKFMYEIVPLINENADKQHIYSSINEKIIIPIKQELGENFLDLTTQHINGMLYFLTGNCHIKWTKYNVGISPSL